MNNGIYDKYLIKVIFDISGFRFMADEYFCIVSSKDFNSEITMNFTDSEKGSVIEFWHKGINVEGEVESHNEAWESIFDSLSQYEV